MQYSENTPKSEVFSEVRNYIEQEGFTIVDKDDARPWGGYFVIDEPQSLEFIDRFFPNLNPDEFTGFSKLSPKVLLVEPRKRLSWQYHYRRSEIWKVLSGKVGVIVSSTNEETPIAELRKGDVIDLKREQRHRLVGLDEWGIVAEIWKHTDPAHPSDEDDIVRVGDDFGRSSSSE